jgi:GNAT superfamily N-acetyltransferase
MRLPEDDISIRPTTDHEEIGVCARMMSATDPWVTLGMDYGKCLEAFDGICKEIHIVKVGPDIAGFVILQVCGTFSGYIQTICIGEDYRGRGIGTALLDFCEKRVLKFSPNLFICVSSFNTGARRLYENFGFKVVGELDNFVRQGFTEILMRKTVGPRVGYKPR